MPETENPHPEPLPRPDQQPGAFAPIEPVQPEQPQVPTEASMTPEAQLLQERLGHLERVATVVEVQREEMRQEGWKPKDFLFGITESDVFFSVDEVTKIDDDKNAPKTMVVRYGHLGEVGPNGEGMERVTLRPGEYIGHRDGSMALALNKNHGALIVPSDYHRKRRDRQAQWGIERDGKQTIERVAYHRLADFLPDKGLTEAESRHETEGIAKGMKRWLHDRFGSRSRVWGEDGKPATKGITRALAINFANTHFSIQENINPDQKHPIYTASGFATDEKGQTTMTWWLVDSNTGKSFISRRDLATGRPTEYRPMTRRELERFKDYMLENVRTATGKRGEDVQGMPRPKRIGKLLGKTGLTRQKK